MSDFESKDQQNMNPETEQGTRVVPTVENVPAPTFTRRRRTDAANDQKDMPDEEGEMTAQNGETPARRPLRSDVQTSADQSNATRKVPQPQALRHTRPAAPASQGVPRPEALKRADQTRQTSGSESEGKQPLRRPVSAPGYSQKAPISNPHAARAVRPEMLDSQEQVAESVPAERRHTGLIAAVIAVLLVAVLLLGVLMIPEDATGVLGKVRGTVTGLFGNQGDGEQNAAKQPKALDFSAAPTEVTVGQMISFTLTTSKDADSVRLVDENGSVLPTMTSMFENADSKIWIMNLNTTEVYDGVVSVQIAGGEAWIDTEMTMGILVEAQNASAGDPADAVITAVPATDVPEHVTEAPTAEPEEVLTAAVIENQPEETEPAGETEAPTVTAAPTATIEATPTLAPSATPTVPGEAVVTQAPVMAAAVPDDLETIEPDALETEEVPDDVVIAEVGGADGPADVTVTSEPVTDDQQVAVPVKDKLVITAADSASPKLIAETVVYDGGKKLSDYQRDGEDAIDMPAGSAYTPRAYGVLTFRGDAFRQNAASGTVGDDDINTMSVKWTTPAGSVRGSGSTTYYGIGWTGQPAIVKWTKEVREISNISDEKRETSALKEVIIAGEDGRIYFLDLEDGQETRAAINLGYPLRGTPSIHPLGFPLMSVGQYARKMASGTGDIGMRIYNLVNQKQLYLIDGLDKSYERPYYSVGSFETSSLIDAASDTMISAGTNGMLYLTKLNSSFEYNAVTQTGSMGISPSSIAMKSKVKKESNKYTAIESSIAMYQSYVFYADMAGYLRCVDTDTMETKWAVATGDAVEASIALDLDENGQLWLYTANTLQNRSKGNCQIRCFNAATGEQAWVIDVNVTKQKKVIAGVKASPVIGQNQLSDYVYFTMSYVSKNGAQTLGMSGAKNGVLICASKKTGEIVWTRELSSYSYSSPVAVYNDDGKGWIVQASNDSKILLLDGATGEMLDALVLKGKINASPAVYKNTLVIGVQGSKDNAAIYGITLE